jgi:hypothetical protein
MTMIHASCHCGAVQIEIDAPLPKELLDCGCSICRRKGGLWAYYSPKQVRITGATHIYIWGDKMLENHSCKVCACTTHWTAIDKSYDRMGVNARMMEPEVFRAIPVRYSPGPS